MTIDITGKCGEGKTSAALLIARLLQDLGASVDFVNPDAPRLPLSSFSLEKLQHIHRATFVGKKISIREHASRREWLARGL